MMKKIVLLAAIAIAVVYLTGVRACHQVPAEIGAPSESRPLAVIDHVQHPFLAESQRSSMHGGAHNWDINTYPGPLGHKTISKHRKFSNVIGVAPNISFDSQGRLITVSIKLNSIELHLLDPETLGTIAMLELPPKASPSDNSGVATSMSTRKIVYCLPRPTTPFRFTRLASHREARRGS